MPATAPYRFVYVDAGGAARELHERERRYLETEFIGGDGAAPSVKANYEERNGWGDLSGYLERTLLPEGTAVSAAPAGDPNPPMNREELIAWLRRKGVTVTEKSDGPPTVPKPRSKPGT